jgi:hypothetical protein
MNKTPITRAVLLAALATGAVGMAQAETSDMPYRAGEASTMTQGVPNAVTTNSPYSDGTAVVSVAPALVAPGSVVTTTSYYYHPSITAYAVPVVPSTTVMGASSSSLHGGASATTNVPDRAGEASSMTGGVPNMAPNNFAAAPVISGYTVIGSGPTYIYRY